MHGESWSGLDEAPVTFDLHREEGRDVERLGEAKAQSSIRAHRTLAGKHVGVPLSPRRVRDLGDDPLQSLACVVVAVVEGHRVEAMSQRPQGGEHTDGTHGPPARAALHLVPYGDIERHGGIAEIVRSSEGDEVPTLHRPEPAPVEHAVQFSEVQPHHGHAIRERVRHVTVPPMPDAALVDGGVEHHESSTPSLRQASNALCTPSSWNPYPQYAPA